MTLFGRLSFFPFLHLLNLFGAIHKSKIQGVSQTEYELPFTENIYNEKTTLYIYVLFKLQPIGQSITGLLAEAYWSSTTNCWSYFYCIYLQCLQSFSALYSVPYLSDQMLLMNIPYQFWTILPLFQLSHTWYVSKASRYWIERQVRLTDKLTVKVKLWLL